MPRWDLDANKQTPTAESKLMGIDNVTSELKHILAGELRAYVQNLLAGIATPTTDPTVVEGVPMMFLAMEAGAYTNFLDDTETPVVLLAGEFATLFTDGTLPHTWVKEAMPYEAGYQTWESAPENAGKTLADYIAWISRMTDLTELADAVERSETAATASETAQGIAVAAEAQTLLYRDAAAAIVSGGPKGVYATLAALISANPDHAYTYVSIDDGNWNYWNGSTFEAGGIYQTALGVSQTVGMSTVNVPSEMAVKTELNNIADTGLNVFDIIANPDSSRLTGHFLNTGVVNEHVAYDITSKIKLMPNTTYTISLPIWGPVPEVCHGAFYNDNDEYLGYPASQTFTTPLATSYVLFTIEKATYPSLSMLMITKGAYTPLNFLPYAKSFSSSIALPQSANQKKSKNVVSLLNGVIRVAFKYDTDNDMIINFSASTNVNALMAISGFNLALNTKPYPLLDILRDYTVFMETGTDWVGPYKFAAVNNVNGDKLSPIDFTGGWHGYNGDQTGIATARTVAYEIYADGNLLSNGDILSCDRVDIIVINRIQAHNTKLANGEGREAIEETIQYSIVGNTVTVGADIEALEDIIVYNYYGLQCENTSWRGTIHYIHGDSNIRKNATAYSDSGENADYPNVDRVCLRSSTGGNNLIMWIDKDFGIGDRSLLDPSEVNAFTSAYNKSYMNLINGGIHSVSGGNILQWKGGYIFFKGVAEGDLDLVCPYYYGGIKGYFIDCLDAVGLFSNILPEHHNQVVTTILKDATVTIPNGTSPKGIKIVSSGYGSANIKISKG